MNRDVLLVRGPAVCPCLFCFSSFSALGSPVSTVWCCVGRGCGEMNACVFTPKCSVQTITLVRTEIVACSLGPFPPVFVHESCLNLDLIYLSLKLLGELQRLLAYRGDVAWN